MPPWQFPQVAALLLILSQVSVADVPKQPARLPNGLDGCGRNCLYIAIKSLGGDLKNLTQIEEVIGPPPVGGYTMATLAEAAEHFGLNTLGVQTSVENLDRRPGTFACIAHYDRGHYVVVSDLYDGGRGVKVIDPPQEAVTLPRETFESQWSGKALLLSPNPLLAEEDLPIRIPWSTILWGAIGTLLCVTAFGLGWKQVRQLVRRSLIAMTILCISGCGTNSPEAKVVAEGNATGPNIVIEDAKRELGELSVFATIHDVDYTVENRGSETLEIFGLESSCSCAEVKISKTEIRPNETATLRLSIQSRETGDRAASVVIHSNDPVRPRTSVGVSWSGIAPIQLETRQLDFGELQPGEVVTRQVKIKMNEPEVAGSISSVSCHPPSSVSAEQVSETTWLVSVTGVEEQSEYRGSVSFHLKNSWTDSLSAYLSWTVADVVSVKPSRIFFGVAPVGTSTEMTVDIETHQQASQITAIAARLDEETPQITILNKPTPEESRIRLEWTRPDVPSTLGVELLVDVELNNGERRTLRIPMSGLATEQPEGTQ